VSRSGYDVAFVPSNEARPGTVAGVARTDQGVRVQFIFSFGPGPDTLSDELRTRGATWIDIGDRFEFWIERPPGDVRGTRADGYTRLALALEDIGCRVVANRPCLGRSSPGAPTMHLRGQIETLPV
jgi:hypothetical protein